MKHKKLILIASVIIFSTLFIWIRLNNNKAPAIEMMRASKMLTQALNEKSPGFARSTFEEASLYYDSALMEWKNQNEKFILLRNYQKVKYWAEKSMERSEKSINHAKKNMANTHEHTRIRINGISDQFKLFEAIYGNFPENLNQRNEITLSKLLFAESLKAFKNKGYNLCNSKLDSVEISLNQLLLHYQKILIDYFKAYPQWHKMVEQTLHQSKKNKSYAIIIDKLARKLMVYKNGELMYQYPIELGPNWLYSKQQQGDNSTPEGMYKIIDKKQNGQTKYYKALLLDYPNEHDKKRFILNKKQGLIKPDAAIGNLIEIHGSGEKGSDWTNGCIALKDADMDQLFQSCPLGTQVTIVGSTKPLNELSYDLK